MMNDIKLLMVDLDETILMKNDFVSEESKKAIEFLLDKGVEVVWATGRYYDSIPSYFLNNKRINYIATSNGALITNHRNEQIFTQMLNKVDVLKMLEMTKDQAKHVFIVTSQGVYADKRLLDDQDIKDVAFFQTLLGHIEIVDDLANFVEINDLDIKKIEIALYNMEFRSQMFEYLKSLKGVETSSSHHDNIDAVSSLASKANALLHLKDLLGLKRHQTMAIGDNLNDLSMILAAGIGVAMGNGVQSLKDVADFVSDSVENDGFAKAVYKYFK